MSRGEKENNNVDSFVGVLYPPTQKKEKIQGKGKNSEERKSKIRNNKTIYMTAQEKKNLVQEVPFLVNEHNKKN